MAGLWATLQSVGGVAWNRGMKRLPHQCFPQTVISPTRKKKEDFLNNISEETS